MDVFQKLTIYTCITSTVTLVLVCMAMLPHLKTGMVLVRDAVLWACFVLVVCGSIWFSVNRLAGRELPIFRKSKVSSETGQWSAAWTADHDPYYQGTHSD